jgi:hypothetical protein
MPKIIVLAAALVLGAWHAPAHAQWTGYQAGTYNYWNNYQTGQRFTCYRLGNATYCN